MKGEGRRGKERRMESEGMKDGECRNEGWRFNEEGRVMREG